MLSTKTFYSQIYHHELGYNIYLPPDYNKNGKKYPVVFHFHGWTGDESSEIWTMESVYKTVMLSLYFPIARPL